MLNKIFSSKDDKLLDNIYIFYLILKRGHYFDHNNKTKTKEEEKINSLQELLRSMKITKK